MIDTILLALVAILLIGCWVFMNGKGRLLWMSVFGVTAVLVVGAEVVAVRTTGETLTQLFWAFSETSPGAAWAIIACLAVGWTLLLIHLAKRLLRKKAE